MIIKFFFDDPQDNNVTLIEIANENSLRCEELCKNFIFIKKDHLYMKKTKSVHSITFKPITVNHIYYYGKCVAKIL